MDNICWICPNCGLQIVTVSKFGGVICPHCKFIDDCRSNNLHKCSEVHKSFINTSKTKIVHSNLGEIIKEELSWIGIKEKGDCNCGDIVKRLNILGPKWAKEHMDELLDFFEKRAKKYDYAFNRLGAKMIVKLAILRCKVEDGV